MTSPQQSGSPAPRINLAAWWGTIVGLCAVILAGSIFVTASYLKRRQFELENPRPYYLSKLERDLAATNRDGRTVSLGELKGKVFLAGYQYTDCPSACLGMAGVMELAYHRYGRRPDFHIVSISVNPAEDTPEKMDRWVKENGFDAPNWWFLAGDEETIRDYMIRYFKFFGVRENADPATIAAQGKYSHDQRLAVVDGKANVRGYYDVLNPDTGPDEIDRLWKDLEFLLDENEKEAESAR